MNIKLVVCIEKDIIFFRKTHHLSYKETISGLFEWDESVQDRFSDDEFDNKNPHIILFNDLPCGVVGYQATDSSIQFGPLYILPEYQGQGIGSFVLKKFINKSIEEKKTLKLRTLRNNENAKRLYERNGFKVTSHNELHWHMQYQH